MDNSIEIIPLINLLWMFIPIAFIAIVLYNWSLNYRNVLTATARMLIQLFLIGYVLTYLFKIEEVTPIILILCFMLVVSAWITLRPLQEKSWQLFMKIGISLAIGGIITLVLVVTVLDLEPWFSVRYIIPLGGMILSNSMNTVCVSAERFESEISKGANYQTARNAALQAGMIPVINMLVAVGLVSLPGVMTGQILSGISPLIAVRYQIMIMCMVLDAAAISTICYLALANPSMALPFFRGKKAQD